MPPRPRPRPRPQPIPSGSAHPESSSPNACLERTKQQEDEDALFIRNKGRSLKAVNKRVAQAAALAPQSSSPTGSDDDENGSEENTPKLGKNRKNNTISMSKSKALPKWTKKGGILNILGDSDSESENNYPSAYEGTPPKRRRAGTTSGTGSPSKRGKRPRSRSDSRSLTPPPDLTSAQKLYAEQAIQNALRSENMLPTPVSVITVEDDGAGNDVGIAELDPALQSIAQAVMLECAAKRKRDDLLDMREEPPGGAHHGTSSKPPEITVRVKWVPHPEDKVMSAWPQQIWSFTVKRHHSLKELLIHASNKAHVLAEDIVLMRDGKRVFTSVSPDGLGAWDQVDLDACDRSTWGALQARHFRSSTPPEKCADETDFYREPSAAPSEASTDHGDEDSKFKLVLRAQGSKDVTLTVRPTTSCGKIIRTFLAVIAKHGGSIPTSPRKASQVRLCIDGEKQDPGTLVADCDLEGGDMVEVVGL